MQKWQFYDTICNSWNGHQVKGGASRLARVVIILLLLHLRGRGRGRDLYRERGRGPQVL